MIKKINKYFYVRLLLSFIICTFSQNLSAQQIENFESLIKTPTKSSPEAASLGKYGEIPISLNSGIPQIDIPLYSINEDNLDLNISVSYHGSGIKVSEVSSCVGLGWTLNAGGAITREVRGWPDETGGSGYYDAYSYFKNNIEGTPDIFTNTSGHPGEIDSNISWKLSVERGYLDIEPDIFYFNFEGYSGKIIFNQNKQPVFFPFQNLKIEGDINNDWTITAPNGKRYVFGKKEYSSFRFGGQYISTWYLTAIISPKSNEIVEFEYTNDNLEWKSEMQSTIPKAYTFKLKKIFQPDVHQTYVPFCYVNDISSELPTTSITYLKKIKISNRNLSINFNYQDDREDIEGSSAALRLSDIRIQYRDNLLRKYTFDNNHYFVGDDINTNSAYLSKRLRLNSINNIDNTSYTFEYNDEYQMPSYESADVDHWGYYNNARNTSYITPLPEGYEELYDFISSTNLTANKETNAESVQACILKKITYPMGGYSQFTWEANVVSYDSLNVQRDKSCDLSYDRDNYLPSSMESRFNTFMRTSYSDDVDMLSVRTKIIPFVKKKEGIINTYIYGLDNNLQTPGYYRVYLYKFSNDINSTPPSPLGIIPFDITSHQDCNQIFNNQQINISPGTYYLMILATDNPNISNISASVRFKECELEYCVDKTVGGVRIKEIKSGDERFPEQTTTRSYSYKRDYLTPRKNFEFLNYQRSSGKLFMDPYFAGYNYYYKEICSGNLIATNFLVDTKGKPYYYEGSHIGYDEVTEITLGNGFKITKFMNDEEITKRNLVTNERWFDNDSHIRKEVNNSYTTYPSLQDGINKLNIQLIYSKYHIDPGTEWVYYSILLDTKAPTNSSCNWTGIDKSIENTYDMLTNNFVTNTLSYYYDAATALIPHKHIFLTRKVTSNSNSDEIQDVYKYPLDFLPSNNFINNMVSNYIINEPVELIRKKNNSIIYAYYQKYISDTSKEIYECDFSKYPATTTSGIDNYGNLTSNTFYKKRYELQQNACGNLTALAKDDVHFSSFIYGYNETLPVVAIENMNYNQIDPAILSNIKTHSYSESQNKTDIDQDINFIKSSLGSLLNDKDHLITIYTYKPLVGMTSSTDSRGITTYYEYDGFGRLIQIYMYSNGEKQILQHYDYHYQNQ